MSQRPTPPEPIKALLQAHGLTQPSAAFSASLTHLVVARYVPPRVEPYQASAWLGKVVLLVLTGLLLLASYAVPITVSTVLGPSLVAAVLGAASIVLLLEQHRKRLLPQAPVG
jgi:peptidoglycan/LPS O-acetylase OafA/YrhL